MINFSALVLRPAQASFGAPITVTPTKSQPTAAAYPGTGIYALKSVQVEIEGSDTFHQAFQASLGIRLNDYATPPVQGDQIVMTQGSFVVENVIFDGQGGATLMLRETS